MPCRSAPADWKGEPNGILFKLETLEGEPADPHELTRALPNWAPGHTTHFGHKTMSVVGVRDVDADSPPVLVVEDVAG